MRVFHKELHLVDALFHYPGDDRVNELHAGHGKISLIADLSKGKKRGQTTDWKLPLLF
jgi:hypothetical protein